MPGVEAERTSENPSLLAYFQDRIASVQDKINVGVQAHHDLHDLEDHALQLAIERVTDQQVALDKALGLAAIQVAALHEALRELLSQRIAALDAKVDERDRWLKEALAHERGDNALRVETSRQSLEQLTIEQHATLKEYFLNQITERWDSHLREHAQQQESHVREHSLGQLAIDKAAESAAARAERDNQLREQITAERSTYVTTTILDARLNPLERARSSDEGMQRAFGLLFAVLVFVVPLGLHYLLPR